MAGYKYSLSQVSVVITFPGATNPIRFGGQGSMLGSVTLTRKNDRFSAEGDATGGYVVNETLDKTGTCVISIKQFAPLVDTLTSLFNKYDANNSENVIGTEVTGSLVGSYEDLQTKIDIYYAGNIIGKAEGCYLNMTDLALEEENGDREFTFECGSVEFEAQNSLNANPIKVN